MITPAQFGSKGEALLVTFEGFRAQAYQDQRGIWTIGYGHTGPDVHQGKTVTAAQALVLLRADVAGCVACVQRAVTVPLTQNQFDALVCFAYNVGRHTLLTSTLLEKLNRFDCHGAADELLRFDHCNGQVVPGLERRREAEAALFLEAA